MSANALGALLLPLLIPALGTAVYNLAKASPCPFRFHMATEGGWDVGCFAACLLAAALLAAGAPLSARPCSSRFRASPPVCSSCGGGIRGAGLMAEGAFRDFSPRSPSGRTRSANVRYVLFHPEPEE